MTLDEIEQLAFAAQIYATKNDQVSRDAMQLSNALLALLPVVRAAEAYSRITPYSEQGHRDKHTAHVALEQAIDTMRAALGGGG